MVHRNGHNGKSYVCDSKRLCILVVETLNYLTAKNLRILLSQFGTVSKQIDPVSHLKCPRAEMSGAEKSVAEKTPRLNVRAEKSVAQMTARK